MLTNCKRPNPGSPRSKMQQVLCKQAKRAESVEIKSNKRHIPLYTKKKKKKEVNRFLQRIPSISQFPTCARFRTSRPFSVSDGLPALSVACSKNTGFHASPFLSRSRAFSRWASSSSCLTVVALENCLA